MRVPRPTPLTPLPSLCPTPSQFPKFAAGTNAISQLLAELTAKGGWGGTQGCI